jgi:hypothetical protein
LLFFQDDANISELRDNGSPQKVSFQLSNFNFQFSITLFSSKVDVASPNIFSSTPNVRRVNESCGSQLSFSSSVQIIEDMNSVVTSIRQLSKDIEDMKWSLLKTDEPDFMKVNSIEDFREFVERITSQKRDDRLFRAQIVSIIKHFVKKYFQHLNFHPQLYSMKKQGISQGTPEVQRIVSGMRYIFEYEYLLNKVKWGHPHNK